MQHKGLTLSKGDTHQAKRERHVKQKGTNIIKHKRRSLSGKKGHKHQQKGTYMFERDILLSKMGNKPDKCYQAKRVINNIKQKGKHY